MIEIFGLLASLVAVIGGLYAVYRRSKIAFWVLIVLAIAASIYFAYPTVSRTISSKQEEIKTFLEAQQNTSAALKADNFFNSRSMKLGDASTWKQRLDLDDHYLKRNARFTKMNQDVTFKIIADSDDRILVASPTDLSKQYKIFDKSGNLLSSNRLPRIRPDFYLPILHKSIFLEAGDIIVPYTATNGASGSEYQRYRQFGLALLDNEGNYKKHSILVDGPRRRTVIPTAIGIQLLNEGANLVFSDDQERPVGVLKFDARLDHLTAERFALLANDQERPEAPVIVSANANFFEDGNLALSGVLYDGQRSAFVSCVNTNTGETNNSWTDELHRIRIRASVIRGNELYVAGYKTKIIFKDGSDKEINSSNKDLWFGIFDRECQMIHQSTYGGSQSDELRAVVSTKEGSVVAAGYVTAEKITVDRTGREIKEFVRQPVLLSLSTLPDQLPIVFEDDESVTFESLVTDKSDDFIFSASSWRGGEKDDAHGLLLAIDSSTIFGE